MRKEVVPKKKKTRKKKKKAKKTKRGKHNPKRIRLNNGSTLFLITGYTSLYRIDSLTTLEEYEEYEDDDDDDDTRVPKSLIKFK